MHIKIVHRCVQLKYKITKLCTGELNHIRLLILKVSMAGSVQIVVSGAVIWYRDLKIPEDGCSMSSCYVGNEIQNYTLTQPRE
jgi:hypothetical protein